jgi:hypothetical protein
VVEGEREDGLRDLDADHHDEVSRALTFSAVWCCDVQPIPALCKFTTAVAGVFPEKVHLDKNP